MSTLHLQNCIILLFVDSDLAYLLGYNKNKELLSNLGAIIALH
jgi:hypothetical protein